MSFDIRLILKWEKYDAVHTLQSMDTTTIVLRSKVTNFLFFEIVEMKIQNPDNGLPYHPSLALISSRFAWRFPFVLILTA